MLEVGEGEASAGGDDQVHDRPAQAQAAGLAGEAPDDLGPPFDLAQRTLEEVGASQPFAQSERVAKVNTERRQVLGEGGRRAWIVGLQFAHQAAQASLTVGRRASQIEGCPIGVADPIVEVLALGQLGDHVP